MLGVSHGRDAGVRLATCLLLAAVLLAPPARAKGDAPYVPTSWSVVEPMLALARVGPNDFLVDLGSGDGRIVITAAKKLGARGLGIELDPDLVAVANAEASRQGIADRVAFRQADIFQTDFSRATVLTLYLLPGANLRLRDKVLALRPGTRVVSHDFSMGDWRPDVERTVEVPDKSYGPPRSTLFLWVVPARAEGRWRWRLPDDRGAEVELALKQRYQALSGSVTVAGRPALLVNPRLSGDRISFAVVDDHMPRHEFSGRIQGDAVEGTARVERSAARRWTAARERSGH